MNDEKFIEEARGRFRRGMRELDAATASRLARARSDALQQLDRRAPATRWVPAGAAAVLGAAAVALWLYRGPPEPAAPPVAQEAKDLELLLSGEDLELFADLEFYLWLKSQDHAG